jgi:5-hydroxyisourate hydrolase
MDARSAAGVASMITTDVHDISAGEPAVGMTVILEMRQASEWIPIGRGATDGKGRTVLTDGPTVAPGTYRLTFDIAAYHRERGVAMPFFPEVKVAFIVRDADAHYHVPLLLSPFGYSIYKES